MTRRSFAHTMPGALFVRVALSVGILVGALAPAVTRAAPLDAPILIERWAAVYQDVTATGYRRQ